jgi:hypothetical protein
VASVADLLLLAFYPSRRRGSAMQPVLSRPTSVVSVPANPAVFAEVRRLAHALADVLAALERPEAKQVQEVFNHHVNARWKRINRDARDAIARFRATSPLLPSEAHYG